MDTLKELLKQFELQFNKNSVQNDDMTLVRCKIEDSFD